ncbi:NmrA family NAD(P)-binding protein [Nesterenkonia sp. LB17]|uniref:NmrA family NAD(P)-binding protein n=1 Tax=Nesterenkonia sp. LB17 TaxID=2901230 RepID=UPI001F4CAC19|nr:NmrA family NAD(P)-binding protein [Nesterenkonia sp. LB17]MCH8565947.1 NmrA family NAD(P)-binding protein [Nesterenkonia sp. LB17]
MSPPILVTGATGNVGAPLLRALRQAGAEVRPASRGNQDPEGVSFDFTDSSTWGPAFAGVQSMFLVRPPQIGDVRRGLVPALRDARSRGVRHVVLLSVQGAGRVPALPHAGLERWLRRSGLSWTFLRPSYFDQNLSTVFAADIRERNQIMVPAGGGRTAFVDAHDVAEVAAAALLDPAHHTDRIWTPTSDESLTYDEVAEVLSSVLGRTITYRRPSMLDYARHARTTLGFDPAMTVATTIIHSTARLGLAGHLTDDIRAVTGRAPTTLREFALRERAAWEPHSPLQTPQKKGRTS